MSTKGHRSSAGFEHDFQKFCVEHWAEGNGYNVEKEAQGEGEGKRPDIVLHLNKYRKDKRIKRYQKVIVEVQRDIYKDNWYQRTTKKYQNDNLIIIRVENFEKLPRKVVIRMIGKLLDTDTREPKKRKTSDDPWITCPECGNPIKSHNQSKHLKYYCKGRK